MTSLLIELYDRHTIEKNVYQALSVIVMRFYTFLQEKLLKEEKLSLKHSLMEQVPHLKQVHFRQFHLKNLPGFRPIYQ